MYYKATRLVNRTAEYKTSSTINVFTYATFSFCISSPILHHWTPTAIKAAFISGYMEKPPNPKCHLTFRIFCDLFTNVWILLLQPDRPFSLEGSRGDFCMGPLIRSSFWDVCTCLKDDVMYMTPSLSGFPWPECCGEHRVFFECISMRWEQE